MNLGHCELFGHRSSAIFADVDYFPRFDGRYSLADFFSNQLVVSEAIPGNVHYHDSKLQQRKVVLMFKPVVDRQEHFTPSLQMLHQDVVGKASPSQIQDGGDSVVCFQEMFNARVYALIEHDPHRANARRAIRPNALGPRRGGRSPVGASHWGNQRERSRECHLPRRSQERSRPAHGCRQSTECRASRPDPHGRFHRGSNFGRRSFPHKDRANWQLTASIIQCAGRPRSIPWWRSGTSDWRFSITHKTKLDRGSVNFGLCESVVRATRTVLWGRERLECNKPACCQERASSAGPESSCVTCNQAGLRTDQSAS